MAAGDEQDLIEAVVTCEGNLHDPDFQDKFRTLVDSLKSALYISKTKDPFRVRKIEPWNSVRVTISIPKEAAQKLKLLAQQGSNVLRSMGILSVQVEGDQVISLTWAAQNNEATQVILRQTSDEPTGSSGTSGVSSSSLPASSPSISSISSSVASISSPVPLTPGSSGEASGMSVTLDMLSSSSSSSSVSSFRSPNVVAPSGEAIPVLPPKTPAAGTRPALGGPFPFVSMAHAAQAIQRSELSPMLNSSSCSSNSTSGSNAGNSTNSIASSIPSTSSLPLQGTNKSAQPPPNENLATTVSLTGPSFNVTTSTCNVVNTVNVNSESQVTRLIIGNTSGFNSATHGVGNNVASLGFSSSNSNNNNLVRSQAGPSESLQLQLVNVPPPYPGVNTSSSNHSLISSSSSNSNVQSRNQHQTSLISSVGSITTCSPTPPLPTVTTASPAPNSKNLFRTGSGVISEVPSLAPVSTANLSDSTSGVLLAQPVSSPLLVNLLQNNDVSPNSSNTESNNQPQVHKNVNTQPSSADNVQQARYLLQQQQPKKTKRGLSLDGASAISKNVPKGESSSVTPVTTHSTEQTSAADSVQVALTMPSDSNSTVTMSRVSIPVAPPQSVGSPMTNQAANEQSSSALFHGRTIVQGNIRILDQGSGQIRTIPLQHPPPPPYPTLTSLPGKTSLTKGQTTTTNPNPSLGSTSSDHAITSLVNGPTSSPYGSSNDGKSQLMTRVTLVQPQPVEQHTATVENDAPKTSPSVSSAADQSRTLLPVTTVNIVSKSPNKSSSLVSSNNNKDSDSTTFIPPPDPRLSSQIHKLSHSSHSISAKNSSASNLVVQTSSYNSDAKSSTSQLAGRTALANKRSTKDRTFQVGPIPSTGKPRQFLINPLTGHLEPMPNESSSESEEGDDVSGDGGEGRKPSPHKNALHKNKLNRGTSLPPGVHHRPLVTTETGVTVARVIKAPTSDQSLAQSFSDLDAIKGTAGDSSPSTHLAYGTSVMSVSKKNREDSSTTAALHIQKDSKDNNPSPATVTAAPVTGEKIKLRLKREKSEPISPAYKVDVSFVKKSEKSSVMPLPSSVTSSGSSSTATIVSSVSTNQSSSGDQPRVPPLHISLRGKNAAVVVSPRREEKDMPPPPPVVGNTKEPLPISSKEMNAIAGENSSSSFSVHSKSTTHLSNSHESKGKSGGNPKRTKSRIKSFDGKCTISSEKGGSRNDKKISRPKLSKEVSTSNSRQNMTMNQMDVIKDAVHFPMPVLQPAVAIPTETSAEIRNHEDKQAYLPPVPSTSKNEPMVEGKTVQAIVACTAENKPVQEDILMDSIISSLPSSAKNDPTITSYKSEPDLKVEDTHQLEGAKDEALVDSSVISSTEIKQVKQIIPDDSSKEKSSLEDPVILATSISKESILVSTKVVTSSSSKSGQHPKLNKVFKGAFSSVVTSTSNMPTRSGKNQPQLHTHKKEDDILGSASESLSPSLHPPLDPHSSESDKGESFINPVINLSTDSCDIKAGSENQAKTLANKEVKINTGSENENESNFVDEESLKSKEEMTTEQTSSGATQMQDDQEAKNTDKIEINLTENIGDPTISDDKCAISNISEDLVKEVKVVEEKADEGTPCVQIQAVDSCSSLSGDKTTDLAIASEDSMLETLLTEIGKATDFKADLAEIPAPTPSVSVDSKFLSKERMTEPLPLLSPTEDKLVESENLSGPSNATISDDKKHKVEEICVVETTAEKESTDDKKSVMTKNKETSDNLKLQTATNEDNVDTGDSSEKLNDSVGEEEIHNREVSEDVKDPEVTKVSMEKQVDIVVSNVSTDDLVPSTDEDKLVSKDEDNVSLKDLTQEASSKEVTVLAQSSSICAVESEVGKRDNGNALDAIGECEKDSVVTSKDVVKEKEVKIGESISLVMEGVKTSENCEQLETKASMDDRIEPISVAKESKVSVDLKCEEIKQSNSSSQGSLVMQSEPHIEMIEKTDVATEKLVETVQNPQTSVESVTEPNTSSEKNSEMTIDSDSERNPLDTTELSKINVAQTEQDIKEMAKEDDSIVDQNKPVVDDVKSMGKEVNVDVSSNSIDKTSYPVSSVNKYLPSEKKPEVVTKSESKAAISSSTSSNVPQLVRVSVSTVPKSRKKPNIESLEQCKNLSDDYDSVSQESPPNQDSASVIMTPKNVMPPASTTANPPISIVLPSNNPDKNITPKNAYKRRAEIKPGALQNALKRLHDNLPKVLKTGENQDPITQSSAVLASSASSSENEGTNEFPETLDEPAPVKNTQVPSNPGCSKLLPPLQGASTPITTASLQLLSTNASLPQVRTMPNIMQRAKASTVTVSSSLPIHTVAPALHQISAGMQSNVLTNVSSGIPSVTLSTVTSLSVTQSTSGAPSQRVFAIHPNVSIPANFAQLQQSPVVLSGGHKMVPIKLVTLPKQSGGQLQTIPLGNATPNRSSPNLLEAVNIVANAGSRSSSPKTTLIGNTMQSTPLNLSSVSLPVGSNLHFVPISVSSATGTTSNVKVLMTQPIKMQQAGLSQSMVVKSVLMGSHNQPTTIRVIRPANLQEPIAIQTLQQHIKPAPDQSAACEAPKQQSDLPITESLAVKSETFTVQTESLFKKLDGVEIVETGSPINNDELPFEADIIHDEKDLADVLAAEAKNELIENCAKFIDLKPGTIRIEKKAANSAVNVVAGPSAPVPFMNHVASRRFLQAPKETTAQNSIKRTTSPLLTYSSSLKNKSSRNSRHSSPSPLQDPNGPDIHGEDQEIINSFSKSPSHPTASLQSKTLRSESTEVKSGSDVLPDHTYGATNATSSVSLTNCDSSNANSLKEVLSIEIPPNDIDMNAISPSQNPPEEKRCTRSTRSNTRLSPDITAFVSDTPKPSKLSVKGDAAALTKNSPKPSPTGSLKVLSPTPSSLTITPSTSTRSSPILHNQHQINASNAAATINAVALGIIDKIQGNANAQSLKNSRITKLTGGNKRKRQESDSSSASRDENVEEKSEIDLNSRPGKRKCSENAAEMIKVCIGVEDSPKRSTSVPKKTDETKSKEGKGKKTIIIEEEDDADSEVSVTRGRSGRSSRESSEDRSSSRGSSAQRVVTTTEKVKAATRDEEPAKETKSSRLNSRAGKEGTKSKNQPIVASSHQSSTPAKKAKESGKTPARRPNRPNSKDKSPLTPAKTRTNVRKDIAASQTPSEKGASAAPSAMATPENENARRKTRSSAAGKRHAT